MNQIEDSPVMDECTPIVDKNRITAIKVFKVQSTNSKMELNFSLNKKNCWATNLTSLDKSTNQNK